MKIFSAQQVREWDAYTIAHEPVSSVNLMERAALACYRWLTGNFKKTETYAVFCGTGNNGGDGLAIARMLLQAGHTVSIYVIEGEKRSEDFSVNLARLHQLSCVICFISNRNFPEIPAGTIVIDAILGSGLTRPLHGLLAEMVSYINEAGNTIISVDIPTGLMADAPSPGDAIILARYTLSFQSPKLAFLVAENNMYTGTVQLLNIGLHPDFYNATPTLLNTIDETAIRAIYKPRDPFAHKYNLGHALLIAGSKDMMGAAILCAKACLRSGAGLVTVLAEPGTQAVIQAAFPEAITATDTNFQKLTHKKAAAGIGPGLEQSHLNYDLLKGLVLEFTGPIVIDASALQLLAADNSLLAKKIPLVLTPHTGEFEKLFGKTANGFEGTRLAMKKAVELGCYIVLKGHHTLIACPDGNAYFNTTGNAGMATAGSGDVLTGMITGLLAQGYGQKDACVLGVYLHGLAGDIAAKKMSQEAMIASDIIDCIGEGYKKIQQPYDLQIS